MSGAERVVIGRLCSNRPQDGQTVLRGDDSNRAARTFGARAQSPLGYVGDAHTLPCNDPARPAVSDRQMRRYVAAAYILQASAHAHGNAEMPCGASRSHYTAPLPLWCAHTSRTAAISSPTCCRTPPRLARHRTAAVLASKMFRRVHIYRHCLKIRHRAAGATERFCEHST